MAINMSDLRQIFRDRQYKMTSQRQAVLQAFVDNPKRHLSAEDVYSLVHKEYSEIGLATVYRALELLSDLEILQKINFGDGRYRYEINESTLHHHHHLICMTCGKVREFEDDLLETLEMAVADKSDFTIVDHQLKFYGYCHECREKDKMPKKRT